MENKEKIILVLKESIKVCKESNYTYPKIYEKHKEIVFIPKFNLTMNDKMLIFQNLDENSHTFKSIYNTAKLACSQLQNNKGYNHHSAELILKFNQLEDLFKRKLKSIGLRVLDEDDVKIKQTRLNTDGFKVLEENDDDEIISLTKNASFVKPNISGKKFNKIIKDQEEYSNALREININEE